MDNYLSTQFAIARYSLIFFTIVLLLRCDKKQTLLCKKEGGVTLSPKRIVPAVRVHVRSRNNGYLL